MSRSLAVVGVSLALLCAAHPVRADQAQADALVEEGNQLGAKGLYAEAIDKFKQADALVPRPLHACNIGLAYVRLSLWASAHYYLARCKTTWAAGALPAWVDRRIQESETQLHAGNFALLKVSPTPATGVVKVAPFPGEPLSGQNLWLPFGNHTVTVAADGYESKTQGVLITSKTAQTVTIALARVVAKPVVPEPAPTQPQPAQPQEPTEPMPTPLAGNGEPGDTGLMGSSAWLYAGIASGGVAVALGVAGVLFRGAADEAKGNAEDYATLMMLDDPATAFDDYEADVSKFNSLLTVSFIGAGVTAAASAYFFYRYFSTPSGPIITGHVGQDNGTVSASWRF